MPKILQEIGVVVALAVPLVAPNATAQTWDFAALRTFASLSADQWNAVNRGETQAKILTTQDKREVAVIGVAFLRATAACFLGKFQDIQEFKKNPSVLKIRKLVLPLASRDLQGLALESRDIADLPGCRLGNCKVKLPARAIERLGRDVDWSRPDYAVRAQSLVSEGIAELPADLRELR